MLGMDDIGGIGAPDGICGIDCPPIGCEPMGCPPIGCEPIGWEPMDIDELIGDIGEPIGDMPGLMDEGSGALSVGAARPWLIAGGSDGAATERGGASESSDCDSS